MRISGAFLVLMLLLACLASEITAVPRTLAADTPGQGPDPYLDFAQKLFEDGDYYRAITEAKRFLFLRPQDPRKYEAMLLIARAYLKSGQYQQAKEAFLPLVNQKERPDTAAAAVMELGLAIEYIDTKEAAGYYQAVISRADLPEGYEQDLRNRARYRLGWLYLEAGRWAEARAAFEEVAEDHKLKVSAVNLARHAPEGRDLPVKSPQTAGIMSAVLPGAGQVYVERPVDAALAFVLNALFLYGTIEAAQDENWGVFTLLGLIEIGWYGGNIYNAVNGAHIYNREVKGNFLKKLRRDYGLDLSYAPKSQGFLLTWSFNY